MMPLIDLFKRGHVTASRCLSEIEIGGPGNIGYAGTFVLSRFTRLNGVLLLPDRKI
jgi:hypothetical protein